MLNAIVPPPMELASVIAWRNEPKPASAVFVTEKTKGDATVASGSLALPTRVGRVERVVLNAKLEASMIEQIDNKPTVTVIRSAKARAGVFFFIFFVR
jgi:hypothetical protein